MSPLIEHVLDAGTEVKRCSTCTEWKPLEQYTLKKSRSDGLCDKCKSCWAEYRRERSQKDKDYRKANRDKVNRWNRNMYNRSKEQQTDVYIQRRLKENIARRLRLLLEGRKSQATTDLLGCSSEQFKTHLESTWEDGMSWFNYGTNGWHIDHIIPCAAFDHDDEAERNACWNWRNLRALWGAENLEKSAEYNQNEKDAYMRTFTIMQESLGPPCAQEARGFSGALLNVSCTTPPTPKPT